MAFWDGYYDKPAPAVTHTEIITHTSGRYEVVCRPDGEVVSFKKLSPDNPVEKVLITIHSKTYEVGMKELARLINGGARITSITGI